MRDLLHLVLDAVLGPRCIIGCNERVFPKDAKTHYSREHAGDRLPTSTTPARRWSDR